MSVSGGPIPASVMMASALPAKAILPRLILAAFLFGILYLSLALPAYAQRPRRASGPKPVLWQDPGDIKARNLFYGPGSPELAPVPPSHLSKKTRQANRLSLVLKTRAEPSGR